MIDSSVIVQFVIVQLSFALTPGLIIALVANESVKNGRKKGIEIGIGAAFGAIVMAITSSLVVSYVFSIIPIMTTVIYFIGSIYILFKGISNISLPNKSYILFLDDIEIISLIYVIVFNGCHNPFVNTRYWQSSHIHCGAILKHTLTVSSVFTSVNVAVSPSFE